MLLAIPSLVQALELVSLSTLAPVQLMGAAEHGFCYFSECKDQLVRKEEREASLLAGKAIRSARASMMKLGSRLPLTWLMGAMT